MLNTFEHLYKFPNGKCFYLPSVDLRAQFPLDEDCWGYPRKWEDRPKNQIIFTDWKNSLVHYADSSSWRQVVSIKGWSPVREPDVKRLLELPFPDVMVVEGGMQSADGKRIRPVDKSLFKKHTWRQETETIPGDPNATSLDKRWDWQRPTGKWINSAGTAWDREIHGDIRHRLFLEGLWSIPLYEQDPKFQALVVAFFLKNSREYTTGKGAVCQLQLGEAFASLWASLNWSGKYPKMLARTIAKERSVLSAGVGDAPKVPLLAKRLGDQPLLFYPHQAQALAAFNRTDAGLLDADMGAGKTMVGLSDALVQIHTGRAQRVAVVMPGAIMEQQKKEIMRFTLDEVHVIIVSTKNVRKNGGICETVDLIKNAPKNTLVLVSYNWLARGYNKAKLTGKFHYPHAQALLTAGVDSVTLDESHNIRNPKSHMSRAVMQLAPFLKVKRCMTGTLLPNTPADVFMQCSFLDTTILGTWDDFVHTFATTFTKSGKVSVWNHNAMKELRKVLKAKGMQSIRRSQWMHLMPPLEKKFHRVVLTTMQTKLYRHILGNIIQDIQDDPQLGAALAKMADESDRDSSIEFGALITKFCQLDMFASWPLVHPLGKDLPELEQRGPKLAKVDEILTHHFQDPDNGKVLVFTQYKSVARHFADNSIHAADILYYDADTKENLEKFKTDPNVRVLVAVDLSLREGHNLQVANRIIRVDMPWATGPVEQSYSRIYRLNQLRNVFIDVLVTDLTAEVTKMARLISKHHTARKVISDFDEVEHLEIIAMSLANITKFTHWEQLEPYLEREAAIDDQEREEGRQVEQKEMVDLHEVFPIMEECVTH